MLPFLKQACEWIDDEMAGDFFESTAGSTAVLVHCFAGINRSPAVVAAYLIWKYGLSATQAMLVVRLARPAARFGRGPRGVLQKDLEVWAEKCSPNP